MKVEGPQGPSRVGGPRRKSANATDSDFASQLEGESAEAAATPGLSGTSASAAVSTILALQAAEGEEGDAAKERAKNRADQLLRELEILRLDILTGSIPKNHLVALAQTIKTSREGVFDPRLNEILDEIDLRAQVELAKYDPYR